MKFQKYLANTCVAEWKLVYVDYKGLKKQIKTSTSITDDDFVKELKLQLEKITKFFSAQCSTLPGRLAYIERMIYHDIGIRYHDSNLEFAEASSLNKHYMKDIKYALFLLKEYHTYCVYLLDFQKLNKIAFVKILKKYDKLYEKDLLDCQLRIFTESPIFQDLRPKVYSEKSEQCLIDIFDYLLRKHPKTIKRRYQGSNAKSTTMKYLRGHEKKGDEFTFFRVGCYIGISIVLIIFSLINIFTANDMLKDPINSGVLNIYGGMFIVVLSFFGFAVDLYIWKYYRINYIFIFELNTNHIPLTFKQFMEFAAISLFLWSLSLFMTLHRTLEKWIAFHYLPLILIGIYISMLLIPFKIFYYHSRKWFLKSIFHIFTPGFRQVSFKDFFIADLMISLTYFWASLYLTSCFYISGDPILCSPRKSWVTPALISIPLVIRFIQCCRKYKDMWIDRDLINALKYAIAITAIFSSSWAIIHEKTSLALATWIFLATISAIFSYYWDVTNDWNVYSKEKIIPRKYMKLAIVANLLLRFNWILTISTLVLFNQSMISFAFGCLEVIRRYMWAIFRMELEHTHNMENFRATKDIPLLNVDDEEN